MQHYTLSRYHASIDEAEAIARKPGTRFTVTSFQSSASELRESYRRCSCGHKNSISKHLFAFIYKTFVLESA
jgi:hypothetical protein